MKRADIGVVLVCAGKGRRFKHSKDKAFVEVGGKPLFFWSFAVFFRTSCIKHIVLVVRKKYVSAAQKYVGQKNVSVVEGGRRRQDSVYKGLQALSKTIDYVLVHDGARPVVGKETLLRVVGALKKYGAVTCGIPVRETVKEESGGFVCKTIKRNHLYHIQTPQGFKKRLLLSAHKRFRRRTVYDDAQLMEFMGIKVKVVRGDPWNIKITYPEDLKMAEALLKTQIK